MANIIEITDDNFKQEVEEASIPVMIDVYAQWCGPCKMIAPVIEAMSNDYDNVKICKADMEENSDLISTYEVSNVPTFLFFKDGKMISKVVGLMNRDRLDKEIEAMIC